MQICLSIRWLKFKIPGLVELSLLYKTHSITKSRNKALKNVWSRGLGTITFVFSSYTAQN